MPALLPRGRCPPPTWWGGQRSLGSAGENWAAFPPAREGKHNRLDARYLPLAYSKQRADRGGCHQPRPAQRDSDAALLNPDRGRGALRPPQALRSGWPGSQGVSPSSFWPTREPVSGGRWPPTLQGARVRGRGFPPQPLKWGLGATSVSSLPLTVGQGVRVRPRSPLRLGPACIPTPQAPPTTLEQLPRCPKARPKPLRPS